MSNLILRWMIIIRIILIDRLPYDRLWLSCNWKCRKCAQRKNYASDLIQFNFSHMGFVLLMLMLLVMCLLNSILWSILTTCAWVNEKATESNLEQEVMNMREQKQHQIDGNTATIPGWNGGDSEIDEQNERIERNEALKTRTHWSNNNKAVGNSYSRR